MPTFLTDALKWLDTNSARGAVVTTAATLVVFFPARVVDMVAGWFNRRATRRRTLIGLYKEISNNIEKLKQFPDDPATQEDFKTKIRATRQFRPLFVVQESTKLNDFTALTLPDIHSSASLAISSFYNRIAEEIAIVKAFEGAAFPTISDDGRIGPIDDLRQTCLKARKEGETALEKLEKAYPRRYFRQLRSGR